MTPEQLEIEARKEAAALRDQKKQRDEKLEKLNRRRNDLYERQLLKQMGVEL